MKNRIFTAIALLLLAAFILTGCSQSSDNTQSENSAASETESSVPAAESAAVTSDEEVVRVDLTAGKDAECFAGLTPETLSLEVIQKGETKRYNFEGVSLDVLLSSLDIAAFTKIELAVSDMEDAVDLTEYALKEAGVFLAWSESGVDETPLRVFPKDASTGNLLTRNVTELVITK